MLALKEVVEQLKRIGIGPDDLVMVHSSLRAIGPVEGGAEALLDALLEVLGPGGTLLIPTFNFQSWTENHYWDILETPSMMGALTEVARARPDALRTPHPIYSFAAIGRRAKEFAACDDMEAYGDNSVFARFHRMDGLIISLGLHFNSTFSLHHYVERVVGCAYRRTKLFAGIYLGRDRRPVLKSYSMFVRRDERVKTWIVPGMTELLDRGIIQEAALGRATVHYCRAGKFFDNMAEIVRQRPEKLHEIVDPVRPGPAG